MDIYYKVYKSSGTKKLTTKQRKRHYFSRTREVLDAALSGDVCGVIDMVFDNDIISKNEQQEFVEMCVDIANAHGKTAYWVEMVDSQASPLISVQDFIVGVIRDHYLFSDDPENPAHELYRSIEGRIIK